MRDIGALLAHGDHDGAVLGVKADVGIRVADLADGLADDGGDIDDGAGGDFAGDDDQPGRAQRFAGHAAAGILREHRVKDRVGDLVGHLIRMALRHRFAGEQVITAVIAADDFPFSHSNSPESSLILKTLIIRGKVAVVKGWIGKIRSSPGAKRIGRSLFVELPVVFHEFDGGIGRFDELDILGFEVGQDAVQIAADIVGSVAELLDRTVFGDH